MPPTLAATDPWLRWDWVQLHLGDILQALLNHVELTGLAIGLGFLISAPLALWSWRSRAVRATVLGITGAIYTIPSLALLALLVPFTGLTVLSAEIALVGYTLLILVRNMVVGLESVPADVREAATAMGYRPWRRLLKIDLPLAIPVVAAGVRIATVTTIGLVTVTALIGEGGLGQLILQGLVNDFKTPLVVGTALSIALAGGADILLSTLQRFLTPWVRSASRVG